MKKKTLLVLSALALFALAFTGCVPKTGNLGPWDRIKEAGVITVGTSPDYPPFETVDEAGKIVGFDIDLIEAMAIVMGVKVELKPMSFDTIVTAVQSGQVNIGISGFSIDPERDVLFSDPYYSGGQVLLTMPNSGIKGPEDLDGQVIAVQMGTTCEKAAETVEGATVTALDDFGVAILMLKNGAAKAVVADLGVANDYVQKDGLVIAGDPLTVEDIAIIVKKGNEDVLKAVNEALAAVKSGSAYQELLDKWEIE